MTETFAELFESSIADKVIWFDKLDCSESFARQLDPEMTLDTYLDNMTKSVLVRYVLGKEEFVQGEMVPTIALTLIDDFEEAPEVTRFAWFYCQLNNENYAEVDRIFQEVYGVPMSDYKKT